MDEIRGLVTETRNQASMKIDQLATADVVSIMNQEDQKVALAVEKVLPEITQGIDQGSQRFKKGGRLIYIGAGTSGRLGALDAIELLPTYGIPPERAFGILAGGEKAMYHAIEGAEDSKELAIADLKKVELNEHDILIGVAASGRTPYTIAAIEYGNQVQALTISVTCNPKGTMQELAQIGIAPVVGPEVITGSTRMKAGTAQKMVLNMLSTGIMIQTGKVFENLMIHVQPTNQKLIERSIGIIQEATGTSREEATNTFEQANQDVALAIVMIKREVGAFEGQALLEKYDQQVARVLAETKETTISN